MSADTKADILRPFGFFLGLSHLLTFYFWILEGPGRLEVLTDNFPACWPFLPDCENWPRFSIAGIVVVLGLYAMVSLASAVFYLRPRFGNWGYRFLALASLLKLFLFLLDYRMSGNYHYMHFWVLAGFFFVPQKEDTLRMLLILFYFGAGILKLNQEWLSGAALLHPTFLQGGLLRAACAYVVVLELILVFGLLSKRAWIFWATLVQLFLFHAFSFLVVGFYYPSLMLCLLSLFVIGEIRDPRGFQWRNIKRLRWPARTFLLLFIFLQALPWMIPGDSALDGRGRMTALSMLDATAECDFKMVAREADGRLDILPRLYSGLWVRIQCDPVLLLSEARHQCRNLKFDTAKLDVSLRSKRKTDSDYLEIFNVEDFCTHPLRVNRLGNLPRSANSD